MRVAICEHVNENLAEAASAPHEQRAAPRFISLIRSAKLVSGKGEFVCVVRDISSIGVRLRCFHDLPHDAAMALELQNGELIELTEVRRVGVEASFRFAGEVPIDKLISDGWPRRRRQLRLNMMLPVTLRSAAGPLAATTVNLSQQGCCIESERPLALAQSVMIETRHLPQIRAKVRWRRGALHGLVFDDTFSLREFAILAARLQCPALAS